MATWNAQLLYDFFVIAFASFNSAHVQCEPKAQRIGSHGGWAVARHLRWHMLAISKVFVDSLLQASTHSMCSASPRPSTLETMVVVVGGHLRCHHMLVFSKILVEIHF